MLFMMKIIDSKTDKMLQVEKDLGVNIEEALRFLYVDEALSVQAISEMLRVSYVTAWKWLQLAGIYSRKLKTLEE